MSDTSEQDALQAVAQLSATFNTVIRSEIKSALMNVHTILVAKVISFDGNLIKAQAFSKRLFLNGVGWKNLPPSIDCPVMFPAGGDWVLTFPIQAGDECLLMFSERCINAWFQNGDISIPDRDHTHSFEDAFAFVGVNSRGRQLSNVQTDGVELRARDRSTYIKMSAGLVEVKGNLHVTGDVVANSAINPISLETHIHTDPQGGDTGVPV
jgi:hypothetical protein